MEMLHGILILVLSLSTVHCQECFVPGQCVDSDLLKHSIMENDIACLKDCRTVDGCMWYTFKPQFNLCELFANCLNRTTADCPGCTSGETDCNPYQCEVTGSCYGHLIKSTETSSYNQCLKECEDTNTCAWFTFEKPINMCYLLSDCVSLDETCQQCTSGEAGCPLLNEGYTKIIIATGWDGSNDLSSVEVIDTSDSNTVCSGLPPYPKATSSATGGLIGNTPLICGGGGEDTCYALVKNNWQLVTSMTADRWRSASAVLGNSLMVTGGVYLLDSSDLVGLNSSKPGPTLPGGVERHCSVSLNDSTIMIIGGLYRDLPKSKATYYYHLDIDHWTKGPDLNTGRYAHSCGTIKSSDQVTVVVAGGFYEDSVEVLRLGSSEWSYGTPLPLKIGYGQLVPDATGKGVLLTGGQDANYNRFNTIYHMACVGCDWVKMAQSLKTGRSSHVAIPVHDDLVTCQ